MDLATVVWLEAYVRPKTVFEKRWGVREGRKGRKESKEEKEEGRKEGEEQQ